MGGAVDAIGGAVDAVSDLASGDIGGAVDSAAEAIGGAAGTAIGGPIGGMIGSAIGDIGGDILGDVTDGIMSDLTSGPPSPGGGLLGGGGDIGPDLPGVDIPGGGTPPGGGIAGMAGKQLAGLVNDAADDFAGQLQDLGMQDPGQVVGDLQDYGQATDLASNLAQMANQSQDALLGSGVKF